MRQDELTQWRNELHQIPELGLEETKTTDYLIAALQKMGYHPNRFSVTGCYLYLDFGADTTIAFRSDIDGLAIEEKSDHPFPSKHLHMMHACGHDGHMTCLLGLAKALLHHPSRYNILLLFQPAEEHPGGAKIIVESGLLERYHVKAIFGLHLMPDLKEGLLYLKSGPAMAQCAELDIMIHGCSSHAGMPEKGVDSIYIAAMLINAYQGILTRSISPLKNAIIHIGQIEGGRARNSIADLVALHGTIRAVESSVFTDILARIKKINQALMEAYDCQIELSCSTGYPPVVNDRALCEQLFSILTLEKLEEPYMLAEDFSFYQQAVPGVFLFLGCRNTHYHAPLHSPQFNFDPIVLQTGINAFLKIIDYLK